MDKDESDLETAFKVVAIMQTITEDLDENGRRMWRKMLGQVPMNEKELMTNRKEVEISETKPTEVHRE